MPRALLFLLMTFAACAAARADWPMWRYNAQRGATTPTALPKQLHLHWVRELPAPRPAWPQTQTKLQFDTAPQPVVMGERLFVPSNVNDSVSAYATRSCKLLWRFFADGPVRFAPVAKKGRVYFVSDDGHLYCVSAEDGKLIWKVNGGPAQRLIIGNHRMVSSWPARGGPVLHDGKVFFAASIWPFMGIFINCVDADTGATVWTNSGDGTNYTVQPHGAPSFATVVPQGHLVVSGDGKNLIVPGGRSVPAVYDIATGKLSHFRYDKKNGHHSVSAVRGAYFVGGLPYSITNGAPAGKTVPSMVLDGNTMYTVDRGAIGAEKISDAFATRLTRDARGKPVKTQALKTETVFRATMEKPVTARVMLKAGPVIYTASRGGAINAFDVGKPAKQKKSLWSATVEGDIDGMLAADNRLFVVTRQGRIYCYGADQRDLTRLREKVVSAVASDSVNEILQDESIRAGFCLSIGVGRLIESLVKRSQLHVVGVDASAKTIDVARRRFDQLGFYGPRVSFLIGGAETLALPPYFATLVIAERIEDAQCTSALVRRVFNSLRPYGGQAYLGLTAKQRATFGDIVQKEKFANVVLTRNGRWTILKRVGALPGTDDWTHQYGNAAQTVVSRDKVVKAPMGVLWFGGPSHEGVLPRHGHGPSPQVAGGRLFIEGPDKLRAVDVYTGRMLWEKELRDFGKYYNTTSHFAGAGEIGSNYVSLPDRVYCVYGSRILALDSATGELEREFKLEGEGEQRPDWGFIAASGNHLIATSAPVQVNVSDKSTSQTKLPQNTTPIIARHAKWRYLAGSDPESDKWNTLAFDDSKWKTGAAGFGYGDGDDRTTLDMRGKFTRVYARARFDAKDVDSGELGLMMRFDDGFVAYLNGKEVARSHVTGSGKKARVSSHEAGKFEYFALKNGKKQLRPKNVLAIVGYNNSAGSSDFTLDPVLVKNSPTKELSSKPEPTRNDRSRRSLASFLPSVRYASGSRRLVVFDRRTGKKLWSRDARMNFRHNNIAIGNGKVFCLDGMTHSKLSSVKGVKVEDRPVFYALDLRTGREIWRSEEHAFGTFVNYSADHDIVVQAGSQYRDRAKDEVGKGMVAFRGSDGKVLWKSDVAYGGPCLLWRDKILTNGGGGFALDMKTGKQTGWTYKRMYGCNTAIGSEHLLTFRSGAAGFFDLANDSGTGNLGGFRSSCTNNLIVANGVLNAPDYTRTCSCAYQNQTSLALIHMPEAEFWTYGAQSKPGQTGINFGAPGDRRAANGTLWLDVPNVGGPSQSAPVSIEPKDVKVFRVHSSTVSGELNWVASSGIKGVRRVTVKVEPDKTCSVQLHFVEPDGLKTGERVFDVSLQGKKVLTGFDIARESGASGRAIMKSFKVRSTGGRVEIVFRPVAGQPVLCGVEVRRMDR